MIYPYNGKSIVGEWKNGKEWNTKHTKKDGTLIGKFENGEWISWGVLYFKYRNEEFRFYTEKWEGVVSKDNINEGKYEGEIKNGIPNGQGTITSPDGEKYVGGWKNGKINGQGTITLPDEGKDVGEWKENKPWNITQYDKDGNIIGRFVNGKYIKP